MSSANRILKFSEMVLHGGGWGDFMFGFLSKYYFSAISSLQL